jgi:hypothetical protein
MPRSDHGPIDWRGWIALAWALAFGLRYVLMVIECRLMR